MTFLDNILSRIGIQRPVMITLKGTEREGGYMFISSPQLKGFSLLLEPGDYSDFRDFVDAVDEPLKAYMDIYREAQHKERLRLRSTKLNEDGALVAQMCFG